MWAAKEATYKVLVKMIPEVAFVPRLYSIEHLIAEKSRRDRSCVKGFVRSHGILIPFHGEVSEFFVHVCAVYPHLSLPLYWEILPCGMNHSEELRKRLVHRIAHLFSVREDEVCVMRDKTSKGLGPPYVVIAGQRSTVDVSMSHDYGFAAYAIHY